MMAVHGFAPEIGHIPVQQQILKSFSRNRIPHAYLFHGPEGCGKEAFAIGVAQLINSSDENGQIDRSSPQFIKIAHLQHPDVKLIFPIPSASNQKSEELQEALREKARNPYRKVVFPGKNTFIGINTIRELKKEAGYKRYEGKRKVFIISEADQMRTEAANALLKLLEEPPDNLMLILVTANIHHILPTIKSRCQILRFSPLPEADIQRIAQTYLPKLDPELLPLYIRLAGNNIKRLLTFVEEDVLEVRDQAIELLRKIVLLHRAQELLQILESMIAKRDRQRARLMLWFLLLWFQDIVYWKSLDGDRSMLRNIDKIDTLEKFIAFTPNADITGIVWEIEGAIRQLNDARNLNPLLVLTTLAIKLHTKIKNTVR